MQAPRYRNTIDEMVAVMARNERATFVQSAILEKYVAATRSERSAGAHSNHSMANPLDFQPK
jgi:hypothetical protein